MNQPLYFIISPLHFPGTHNSPFAFLSLHFRSYSAWVYAICTSKRLGFDQVIRSPILQGFVLFRFWAKENSRTTFLLETCVEERLCKFASIAGISSGVYVWKIWRLISRSLYSKFPSLIVQFRDFPGFVSYHLRTVKLYHFVIFFA